MDARETVKTQKRYDRQAATYDLRELPMEVLGFGRLRGRLWQQVLGARILEVGAGTGKNFRHHPPNAAIVAVDISPRMLAKAAERARRPGRRIDLVLADAQRLPFRDGTFDAAVASFVFCSVPDPLVGLQEVRRVVKDAGGIHLLEHVRARNRVAGWLMDRLNPLVVRMAGANINRDTVGNVQSAGIALADVQSRWLGIVKLMRGAPGRQGSAAARDTLREAAA